MGWSVANAFSDRLYLMVKRKTARYAPLYIHRFSLVVPVKFVEAEQFTKQYQSYESITSIPDRLKWCRYHKGLLQKEVADRAGISRATYLAMENGTVDFFERCVVNVLAELFGISPFDLLDEYNRFMYLGQGKMTRACRARLGMGQRAFAELVHTTPECVHVWETEKKRLSKRSWERYYRGR